MTWLECLVTGSNKARLDPNKREMLIGRGGGGVSGRNSHVPMLDKSTCSLSGDAS